MAKKTSISFEQRYRNAVEFIWTAKLAGRKIKITPILDSYHIGHSYKPAFDKITGEESDFEELFARVLFEGREATRKKNNEAKQVEAPADLFNPETLREEAEKLLKHNVGTPQEVNIDRLRAEIREEVINELRDRDKEYAKSRRCNVAFGVLTSLIPLRHKERPDEIAKRAVRIADEFLEELNKTE